MIGTPALNGWAITFDTTTQKDGGYQPTQPDRAALPNAIMQLLGLHAPLSIEVCRPVPNEQLYNNSITHNLKLQHCYFQCHGDLLCSCTSHTGNWSAKYLPNVIRQTIPSDGNCSYDVALVHICCL